MHAGKNTGILKSGRKDRKKAGKRRVFVVKSLNKALKGLFFCNGLYAFIV
jgi:hypothetical protein